MKNNYRYDKKSDSVFDETRLSKISKLRLEIPLEYLRAGKNVLVLDVHIHWNFNFRLTQLPHQSATIFPEIISRMWGFTICECL